MREEQSASAGGFTTTILLLFALAVVGLSLAGYLGYVLFPRFDLPAASGASLFLLAAAAGIASFFSPCSFPLLVTLLTGNVEKGTTDGRRRRAFLFASALSLGAAVFLLLTGVVIALGASTYIEEVTFTSTTGRVIRVVVGSLLVLLGLAQLGVIHVAFDQVERMVRPLQRRQARYRRERPVLGFALFGFTYILAGFGWTGPILAGLAGHALTVGGVGAAFSAFVVAAVAIVLLFFVLALGIATARDELVRAVRARVATVKRTAGVVVIGVGAWLIALGLFANFFSQFFEV